MDLRFILCVLSFIYFSVLWALPVTQEKKNDVTNEKKIESEMDDLGLEYGRYLQQVVEALEQDKEFAKKLENVSQEEIKNGAIARELNFVSHHVRNKLDELKRIELDRLRQLAKKEHQLEEQEGNDQRRWRSIDNQINTQLDAQHLDHQNPHSFEAEDLHKLILSATKDLEELDQKRKEDFKQYEMEKELRYREALVNMTDEEREETIRKHDKMEEEHKQHPKVHHPGSKQQLEQVWQEQDHMPREEFNPKVFFTLHDINGDGFLDPQEVEAILTVEIKKMYSDKNPEDDPNEMQEEYHRMREHIYKEADVNRDGLISKKEFLEFTHRMEFERDDGWKGLDEQQVYSEEDLKKYQQQQRQHEQEQYMAYQQQQVPQYYPQHIQQQYQNHPQAYPQGHPQGQQYQNHPQGHPQAYPQQQQQHYIPPPHQMTPEQWHQQQQYYQQLHAQNNPQYVLQEPNPQLHAQQQQQQQQQIGQQHQLASGQQIVSGQQMNGQQITQQQSGHPNQIIREQNRN